MTSQEIQLTRDAINECFELDMYFMKEIYDAFKDENTEYGRNSLDGKKALRVYFNESVTCTKFNKNEVKHIDFKTKFEKNGTIWVNIKNCGTGYDLFQIAGFYNIQDFEIVDIIKKKNTFADLKKKIYDSKTWTDLKEKDFQYVGINFVNIKTKFKYYPHVIAELEKAFRDKTKYHYSTYGTKRDLSVSTQMGEDGIFRAWYSSEYAGCGNGAYYLLLNPTTAVFMEYD